MREQRNTGTSWAGMPIRFGKPDMIWMGIISSVRTILSESSFLPFRFSSAMKLVAMMSMLFLIIIP